MDSSKDLCKKKNEHTFKGKKRKHNNNFEIKVNKDFVHFFNGIFADSQPKLKDVSSMIYPILLHNFQVFNFLKIDTSKCIG
jgi:hypothetical protein